MCHIKGESQNRNQSNFLLENQSLVFQRVAILYPLQYPTEIIVTLTSPTSKGESQKLKKNLQSNVDLLRSWRIGFPTRNCYTGGGLPVAARQQAKKKNIDNRYDYTLHATQDDKHHDNARTN